MGHYKWTDERKQLYEDLCKYGIGYNIPYAKGTFKKDNKGKKVFAQEKAQLLYEAMMDKTTEHLTVEGGKRGSKDVYTLYAWANYLMICPNQLHLVTGNTINHAMATVLTADGFGLKYLIPHGMEKKVKNREVFLFIDYFGVEKQIDFFAGSQYNDREAFRGYSYGSHYANEAINQHYETIKEGATRTNASKWRKIIHTQNPQGGSYEYYEKYEKPLKAKEEMVSYYKKEKIQYDKNAKLLEPKYELEWKKSLSNIEKVFLDTAKVENIEELKRKSYEKPVYQEIYRRYLLEIKNRKIDQERKFNEETRADIRNFVYKLDNVNDVQNGLTFKYFHFNHYDNLSMTDYQRMSIENEYDKSGVTFKREILGIRASAEGAIWDTLTDKNILRGEIPRTSIGERYLVIDFGMKNAFVISDWDVDEQLNCYCWQEKRFDGREDKVVTQDGHDELATVKLYGDMVMEVIASRNNGYYDAIYIDPSATPLRNELINRELIVRSAKNDVGKRREKEKPDKKTDKSIVGIWLVREGFARSRIFIHESCKKGLDECYGYIFDPKKLMIGEEVPVKVADHFPDCVRYLVNSVVKNLRRWELWQEQKTQKT